MMQSEFLDRNRTHWTLQQRRLKLERFMNHLALAVIFMTIGLFLGELDHRRADPFGSFDYDACDYLVAKGNLDTAPIPADYEWSDITTTPGGNWCVTSND